MSKWMRRVLVAVGLAVTRIAKKELKSGQRRWGRSKKRGEKRATDPVTAAAQIQERNEQT